MSAITKGQVPANFPQVTVQVKFHRILEHLGVQVPGRPQQHDLGILLKMNRSQVNFLIVSPEQSLNRGIKTKGFFNRERNKCGVVHHPVEGTLFSQQSINDVRKHDGRRRTPGSQQEPHETEDLVLGKKSAVWPGGGEKTSHQVLTALPFPGRQF